MSHFRNAIPLYWLYDYTTLYDSIRRQSTASYSYDEMLTSLLRDDRMRNRRDRAPFIGNPPEGEGVPGSSSSYRVHMYLAFYRLFLLKDDFCHWNKWEKSTFPGISTFFAEMAGAKAPWLSIQIPRLGLARSSNFRAYLWWVIGIFEEFSQKSRKLIFILLGKESFLPF